MYPMLTDDGAIETLPSDEQKRIAAAGRKMTDEEAARALEQIDPTFEEEDPDC